MKTFPYPPFSMNWSPEFNMPWSGSVTQDVHTAWFSKISKENGNGELEKEIFEAASYGRQLGLILDVLVPLVETIVETPSTENSPANDIITTLQGLIQKNREHEQMNKSWNSLKEIHEKIKKLKHEHPRQQKDKIIKDLKQLRTEHETVYKEILRALDIKNA